MDLVTVIIPAFNQGAYLAHAIRSVLGQTYPEFEVVVVDDGSTDHTASVAQEFTDPRIRFIQQANRGLPAARNTGIAASRGAFLTFLDSDDIFLPEKIAVLAAELQRHPRAGLAAGQAIPIDEDGRPIGKTFDGGLPEDGSRLLLGNPLHVGSVLLRRSWQEVVGGFDETLRSYEDWDLWLRLAREGCPMRWVPSPVSLYRFHPSQMTRDGSQMTCANFAVLDKIFRDPDLPEGWRQRRDEAYSHAFLRASAHCYVVGDVAGGMENLERAVELNDRLLADGGRPLVDRFAAWTDLPKTPDPISFLETVYRHLPDRLAFLRRHRREIGRVALNVAFESHQAGDRRAARAALWRAVRYQPAWMANRGVLSILFRSFLPVSG
jgi:glycosyltransferase involved in cell wall biosynthesis